jgi:hypothetical protein
VDQIVQQFVREILSRVDAIFSYRTENRIPIRFAANPTGICTGNRIRVDGPLCRISQPSRKFKLRLVKKQIFSDIRHNLADKPGSGATQILANFVVGVLTRVRK